MAKQLQALTQSWADVQNRVDAVWGDLSSLIMQYRNPQSGSWPRLVTLLDVLNERLAELGANSAQDAAAANDTQVKKILAEIDNVKQVCRKISKEFWATRGTVFRDLDDLQKEFERVVKEKSGIFSRSSSLPALKTLRASVNSVVADAKFFLKDSPPKPDDAWIN
jgi:hypothetical protein